MSSPLSPFVVGRPLRHDEPIFGREDAFDFIHDCLARYASVNLVGERRLGKTSLLRHLPGQPPPAAESLLVEVDLQANIRAEADFYARALLGILADPRVQLMPDAAAALLRLQARPQADFAEFERWLTRLRAANTVRPVLLVDEFEHLLDAPYAAGFPFPAFFDGLRSLLGANKLALVIASRLTLAEHFERHPAQITSNFPNYLPPFRLRELDEAAAETLLLQGLACGLGLSDVQTARRWAGGHPCRLQCAGQAWVEAKQGKHDAVWARRRYQEYIGQNCLVRVPATPAGLRLKRAGRWLARGPRWLCVELPKKIGGLVRWIGGSLSTAQDWILGMIVILLLIEALIHWRDLATIIKKLTEFKAWLG